MSTTNNAPKVVSDDHALFKSWTELDRSGELESLKLRNEKLFLFKYKEKFGKYPTGQTLDAETENKLQMLMNQKELNNLTAMPVEELVKGDHFQRLKALDEDTYRNRYKAYYGSEPKK